MKTYLLSIFALSFSPTLWAKSFTYEDLQKLIKSKSITSIEQLLPELPQEFRSNYVLMHKSRSWQQASYQAPRVIFFGKDASLTCSFNGDKQHEGFDFIECIQFRPLERAFDFRQIQFPSSRNMLNQPVFSQRNLSADGKTSCLGCHGGKDPRPNWDEYSSWPGSYGESNDTLNKVEKQHYAQFVAIRGAHARYKYLIQGDYAEAPYLTFFGGLNQRPGLRYSDAVNRMNALRVARMLEALPKWQRLAYVVSSLDCKFNQAQTQRLDASGLPYKEDLKLEKIISQTGATPNQWTTRIFNQAPRSTPYEHQGGYEMLSKVAPVAVLKALAEDGHEQLKQPIASLKSSYGTNDYDKDFFYTLDKNFIQGTGYFTNNFKSNVALLCAPVSELFVSEYLQGH